MYIKNKQSGKLLATLKVRDDNIFFFLFHVMYYIIASYIISLHILHGMKLQYHLPTIIPVTTVFTNNSNAVMAVESPSVPRPDEVS